MTSLTQGHDRRVIDTEIEPLLQGYWFFAPDRAYDAAQALRAAMATAIPLRYIWLLFLCTADLVQIKGGFDPQVETARDLPDLVARLLTHVVEERLRRNLSRRYRRQTATLSRVRGLIDILEATTRQLMERGHIACQFEEHTMETHRPLGSPQSCPGCRPISN